MPAAKPPPIAQPSSDPPPATAAEVPEFTRRAVATGMVIGAFLTPCNVYSGLKIGWSFNMSIAAGLLGLGLWTLLSGGGKRPFGLLENNINQTTASSAASIISGGLVAPIPALTLITGESLAYPVLAIWVFAVSILGVVVAAALRHQMITVDRLPFPAGAATAETMARIHGSAGDNARRLKVLFSGAAVAAAVKIAVDLLSSVPRLAIGIAYPAVAGVRAAVPNLSFTNLTFAFDPSLLLIGFGAIIGLRAGISLLLGAGLAWGLLAPLALTEGWAIPGRPGEVWFEPLVTWLLWPGVTLIVVSSLTSFLLSALGVKGGLHLDRLLAGTVHRRTFSLAMAAAAALVTLAAHLIFGISPFTALLAVGLSAVLAVVAARVTGETGITPVGALGKVTQLTFAGLAPGQMTANLMTANITGGAAGQCADLLHDLKTGAVLGAAARLQVLAQAFGVLTGACVGTLAYVLLIPDPQAMLITPEWPAPAVAAWKAVAEVLAGGLKDIPEGAVPAIVIAAAAAVALAVAEKRTPAAARWLPSTPALGLAFVLPAWNSISLFLGAAIAALAGRVCPKASAAFSLPLAAGLVAGESLAGIGLAYVLFAE